LIDHEQSLIVALSPSGDHADERIGFVPAREQFHGIRVAGHFPSQNAAE
jgi:hypothetical protein